MKLIVSAVGHRMPAWVQTAWSEYARRFPRGFSLELREIPLLKRSRNADIDSLLAGEMERWMREEHGVCFLVGGPDGLSQQCVQQAHRVWSLSKLTLPHPMVRTLLAEQLYRAWTITQKHPYHRA